jgi:hypothetical protein
MGYKVWDVNGGNFGRKMVEHNGLEPLTPTMPWWDLVKIPLCDIPAFLSNIHKITTLFGST